MRHPIHMAAVLSGLLLAAPAAYIACSGNEIAGADGDADDLGKCTRPARYSTYEQIVAQRLMRWDEYQEEFNVVLTPEQQTYLEEHGDLVGRLNPLYRPVMFLPSRRIDMPANWLPTLPSDHPWAQAAPPSPTDETFEAYFEVRIVDPLLWERDTQQHITWARTYLRQVDASADGMITSLVGADSGCP